MNLTNKGQRLEGIAVGDRTVYLKPGETRDLELSAADLKRAKRLDSIEVGKAPKEEKPEKPEKAPKEEKAGDDDKGGK